jgi:hypothetical protein
MLHGTEKFYDVCSPTALKLYLNGSSLQKLWKSRESQDIFETNGVLLWGHQIFDSLTKFASRVKVFVRKASLQFFFFEMLTVPYLLELMIDST